jgi:hypothetical protein
MAGLTYLVGRRAPLAAAPCSVGKFRELVPPKVQANADNGDGGVLLSVNQRHRRRFPNVDYAESLKIYHEPSCGLAVGQCRLTSGESRTGLDNPRMHAPLGSNGALHAVGELLRPSSLGRGVGNSAKTQRQVGGADRI